MQPKIIPQEILSQLLSIEFQKRFWSHVNIRDPSDCWTWMAYTKSNGYGTTSIGGSKSQYRAMHSHRVAWIISYFKNIPPNKEVLHTCIGNRACCNPHHLKIGNQKENMQDRIRDGTCPMGESHPFSKLSEEQVVKIRFLYSTGKFTQTEIAQLFDVGNNAVHKIVNYFTWKHL